MLYISHAQLNYKLRDRGIDMSFDEIKSIAYQDLEVDRLSVAELKMIVILLLEVCLSGERLKSLIYDYTYVPSALNLPEIWLPNSIKSNVISDTFSTILSLCNVLSFLGAVPNLNSDLVAPKLPNHSGLFVNLVYLEGNNSDILSTLISLSSIEKPLIIGKTSMAEFYTVVAALLGMLVLEKGANKFQIKGQDISCIDYQESAIDLLKELSKKTLGGMQKPFYEDSNTYLLYYQLSMISNEQKYIAIEDGKYDFLGETYTINDYNAKGIFEFEALVDSAKFIKLKAEILALESEYFELISDTYTCANMDYFLAALKQRKSLSKAMVYWHEMTKQLLKLEGEFFIPFYRFFERV